MGTFAGPTCAPSTALRFLGPGRPHTAVELTRLGCSSYRGSVAGQPKLQGRVRADVGHSLAWGGSTKLCWT